MKVTIVIGAFTTMTKGLVLVQEILTNRRTSGDLPNYSTVETGKNTEKSPEI